MGPTPGLLGADYPGRGMWVCIPNEFPPQVKAVDLATTLWEHPDRSPSIWSLTKKKRVKIHFALHIKKTVSKPEDTVPSYADGVVIDTMGIPLYCWS